MGIEQVMAGARNGGELGTGQAPRQFGGTGDVHHPIALAVPQPHLVFY